MRDLPGGPVAKTRCFHWVQSLVRELRSCKPRCTAEGGKKKQLKTNELAYTLTERTTKDVCLKNNTPPNKTNRGKKKKTTKDRRKVNSKEGIRYKNR